jgi:probable phosphoglycerate mutase
MKVYVARHGQTNYNEAGLLNSDPTVDVYLTDKGIEQAKNLAIKLKDLDLACIFTSELKRTQETASYINEFHNVEIVVDARLNDIKFGFEGKNYSEYHSALNNSDHKWSARFNDGESIEDLRKRVQSFMDELNKKDYPTVLVVTSGGVMQAMYAIANNLSIEDAWDFRPEKGSLIELGI